MRTRILIIVFIFCANDIFAQKTKRNLSYVDDFRYLYETVENVHPDIYAQLSPDEYGLWKEQFAKAAAKIDNDRDFHRLLSAYLARFKDSHTRMATWDFPQDNGLFPVLIRLYHDKFYVVATENRENTDYAITFINGIPVNEALETICRHVSAENELCRRFYLCTYLQYPTYTSLLNGNDSVLELTLSNGKTFSVQAKQHYQLEATGIFGKILTDCRENFWYETDTSRKCCLLHFNHMSDRADLCESRSKMKRKKYRDIPLFSEFLSLMFQDIQKQHIENLIIDLRHNGGGNSMLGAQLLHFIAADSLLERQQHGRKVSTRISKAYRKERRKESGSFNTLEELKNPKSPWFIADTSRNFHGKVYVLTAQQTYSAASNLALQLSHIGCVLVGETTPQPINCFGDYLEFTLPRSGFSYIVSCKYFCDSAATGTDNLLHPKTTIPYDYEDLRNGHDKPLEWIYENIRNDKK